MKTACIYKLVLTSTCIRQSDKHETDKKTVPYKNTLEVL